MPHFTFSTARLLPLLALCCTAGCAQRQSAELEWARAALQRNPNVEIVATDAQAGVFTLRDRIHGTVDTVALKDLVAGPASQLTQTMPATPAVADSTPAPAAAAADSAEAAPSAPQLAQETPASSQPAATADADAPSAEGRNYTIERADGRLKVSGPGVSIVSAGTGSAANARPGQTQPSADPIICEGARMLQLDSREINVDGDAIIARGGCELYITNSRVVASGTGIVVQDAVVHIANSQIEGTTASFNAGSGAKLFVRGSTFRGISRRDEHSSVQDQGGNRWR